MRFTLDRIAGRRYILITSFLGITENLLIVFLVLAALAYTFGTGVDLYPFGYAGFVVSVFAVSEILERKGSSKRGAVVLSASSLIFWLLAGEAIMRVALNSTRYHSGHDRYFELSPEIEGRYRYVPNVDATRTIYGDLAAQSGDPADRFYRTERFATDDRGFRNEPSVRARPIDVLVLGDSFGLGFDTSQEDTWATKLQRKLGSNLYNLSMPGCPSDQLLILQSELPHLDLAAGSTLVWMLFTANDIGEHPAISPSIGYRELGPVESAFVTMQNLQRRSATAGLIRRLMASGTPQVERIVFPTLGPQLFYKPYMAVAGMPAEKLRTLPSWKAFTQSFDSMRQVTKDRFSRVLVLVVPSKAEVYLHPEKVASGSPFAEALLETTERNSYELRDLTPSIIRRVYEEGRDRPRAMWWPDDSHWNIEGHEMIAELVEDALVGAAEPAL